MRDILRRHATGARHIGWIDVHTGLGRNGHGEKIYAGRTSLSDLALARSWWGADVFAPFEGQSESPEVSGPVAGIVYDECPDAAVGLIALEIGTVPFQEIIFHLRACQWLIRHPEAPAQQQREIRQNMRDAYYCDNDAWKGAVWGQARTSLVQAEGFTPKCVYHVRYRFIQAISIGAFKKSPPQPSGAASAKTPGKVSRIFPG